MAELLTTTQAREFIPGCSVGDAMLQVALDSAEAYLIDRVGDNPVVLVPRAGETAGDARPLTLSRLAEAGMVLLPRKAQAVSQVTADYAYGYTADWGDYWYGTFPNSQPQVLDADQWRLTTDGRAVLVSRWDGTRITVTYTAVDDTARRRDALARMVANRLDYTGSPTWSQEGGSAQWQHQWESILDTLRPRVL